MTNRTGTVNIRHDASLRVIFKSGNRVLHDSVIPADTLGAHVSVVSYMFNANPFSGGGIWHDPVTGKPIHKPTYTYELTEPDRDILPAGELCTCVKCVDDSTDRQRP